MIYALIFREELVCLVLLCMMQLYSRNYLQGERALNFAWMNHLGIVQLWVEAMAAILLNLSGVHEIFSRLAYGVSGATLMFYCGVLADMAAGKELNKKQRERVTIGVFLAAALCVVLTALRPLRILTSGGVRFGTNAGLITAKALSIGLLLVALLPVFVKDPPRTVRQWGIPGSILLMLATALVQIFFPQGMFLGAAETIGVAAVFISVISPTESYRQKAFIDDATSIKNKNCFTRDLEIVEKQLAQYPNWSFACISADMDYLKTINDNYGHEMGDSYLRMTSSTLQAYLGSAYGVYRTGGDEFVALYLNTASRVVEQELREVREKIRTAEPGCAVPLSVSVGLAWRQPGQTAAEVIRQADKAMYTEKRRNHIQRTVQV